MNINPLTAIDFYKADHRRQYPVGTTEVYSNFTARSSKLAKVIRETFDDQIVFFGLQYFIKDFLINSWNKEFFNKPKHEVVKKYKRRMDFALGQDSIPVNHIEQLHSLGYLPFQIKALPEGSRVPIGVPLLTIVNTEPNFFWLTNYIETIISCYLWKPITSATTAFEYKKLLTTYAKKTGTPIESVVYQVHDFSFRGMSSLQDASVSGGAHLTSFVGTDTVSAIDFLEDYYNANVEEAIVGCSVPATEHSVMCMGLEHGELATFRRLINELYPKGIVSIVSDTWDFWKVITEYLSILKPEILARDGKVMIRPDSGDQI
ncbi:MAG: nicotinamide phosphoribosyltransferase, partial [Francisellaceae bacterium]